MTKAEFSLPNKPITRSMMMAVMKMQDCFMAAAMVPGRIGVKLPAMRRKMEVVVLTLRMQCLGLQHAPQPPWLVLPLLPSTMLLAHGAVVARWAHC